ncbi:MAG: PAS domain S-box protein [Bacteroidetes bacterium]|jgi:PAS domain S-box-containing protein|nr:PAS domain S-box protein [Bacteroidota bacterium]
MPTHHGDHSDPPASLLNAPQRLAALRRYGIMDTPAEEAFDRLTRLAARVLDVPIALITLLDDERQWFKSCVGLDRDETPRSQAFCAYNVTPGDVMVVEDATQDPRFKDNPLVTGPPHIRFYAGAPLFTPDGHTLGSLCVIAPEPRTLAPDDAETLKELAAMVVDELELRLVQQQRTDILESISDAFYALDTDWRFTYVNQEAERMLERSREELLGRNVWEVFPEAVESVIYNTFHLARETHERQQLEVFYPPLNAWFDATAYPHAGGLSVYFRDITDERAATQERRILAKAVEVSQEAVLITEATPLNRPGPRITYVNPAFEAMTGYTADEIIGDTPRVLQGPETERHVLDSFREALEAENAWSGETINYRSDGSPYRVQWNVAPLYDEDGVLAHWVSVQRDVTDERAREQRLREQRTLLEQTQRLAGGWQLDMETKDITWSSEVYRIHEVEEGTDLVLDGGLSFYTAEARPIISAAVEHCIETGTPWDLELPLCTAKGNERWVRVVGAVTEWADGEAVQLAGAFQDITERYEAQLALHEREQRIRGIADSVPGVLFQFFAQPDGVMGTRFVSARANEVLGLPPEDFFAEVVARIPGPYQAPFWTSVKEAVQNNTMWELEFPFDRPDGARIWLRGASSPVQHETERVFNGVLLDITERKEREREQQRAYDRMQLALKETHSVIFEVDLDTKEVAREGDFANVFYQPPEHVPTWEDFIERAVHPDDRPHMRAFFEAITAGILEDPVVDYRTNPVLGPVRWLRGEIHRLDPVDSDARQAIGIVRDVTQQKAYEQGLIEARREAEEMNRLKSAFLTNMSHEIRTPLTGIIGYAELLAEMDLDLDASEFAEAINHSGQRLLETLTSLLDLSQLEAGSLRLFPQTVPLATRVAEVAHSFHAEARRKDVALQLDLPADGLTVQTDPGAVERILNNLIGNAIKFTPAGGSVTLRMRPQADGARMEVADTGVGIDPAFLPNVFTPFKQESAGLGREFEGNGLGLAITKQLVDLLGGTITVDSTKGEGTTFTVILPPLQNAPPADAAA